MPKVLAKDSILGDSDPLYAASIIEMVSAYPCSIQSLIEHFTEAGVDDDTIKCSLRALVDQGKLYFNKDMNLATVNRSQSKRKTSKKAVSVKDTYKLPKPVLLELSKIMEYNDSCSNVNLRVTREETVLLLNQYGWTGSSSSLNRLLKANFDRSFTGSVVSKTQRAR